MVIDNKEPLILYSFGEAIEKIKRKEMKTLIRAKWIEADYFKRVIKMWCTEHISLEDSCVSGVEDCLRHWSKNKEGGMTGVCAKIHSDDILAEDYIDSNQWILCNSIKEFDEKYR